MVGSKKWEVERETDRSARRRSKFKLKQAVSGSVLARCINVGQERASNQQDELG